MIERNFPKNSKMSQPLSLKLWKERKYATEIIPVKNYKKGLKYLEVKTVKDITNHLLKLEKVLFTVAHASVYSNVSLYSLGHQVL